MATGKMHARQTMTTKKAMMLALPLVGAMAAGLVALSAAQDPKQMSREDLLAYHTKDGTTGSAADGRALYEERCAACHRFGAIGKDVGPDLTTIAARFKKRDVMDSILWPSKTISDQYQAEMFELKDGKIVSGLIVRETAAAVLVRTADAPEKPITVPKGQIGSRAPSTTSLMPEGLLEGWSNKQIADLLAFVMAPPPDK